MRLYQFWLWLAATFADFLTATRQVLANERGSVTVDQAWVYRFHDQLLLCYQQMKSLLENLIDPGMVHRDVGAAIDHHERLGNVIANDVISPFGQTKILNPVHSRRAVTLQSSDAAVLVSDEHTLRSMVNPQNGYTRTIVAALGRRADKHIIDAATGTASTAAVTSGTGVITYGTQALPSARKIGGATAMSLTRVVNAAELLSKSGAPNGAGQRIMLYSPGQLRDILAITQASSSDFTRNQIHDKGTIDGVMWEGFNWIEIADVMDPDGSTVLGRMLALSGTTRSCIAFHRGAIGLSIGQLEGAPKINERADLNNSIQVRQVMKMAAGRVWEGGVVQVDALEN